jgi:hypothetical protein
MKPPNEIPNLSAALDAFASTPNVTEGDVARIGEVNVNLDSDPKFLADLQKAKVAQVLRKALDKRGETISSFATRWQKTKQYVSKILNLDQRTNFTIETITQAAVLLNLRVSIQIHRPEQEVIVRSVRSCRGQYRTRVREIEFNSGKAADDGSQQYPLAA